MTTLNRVRALVLAGAALVFAMYAGFAWLLGLHPQDRVPAPGNATDEQLGKLALPVTVDAHRCTRDEYYRVNHLGGLNLVVTGRVGLTCRYNIYRNLFVTETNKSSPSERWQCEADPKGEVRFDPAEELETRKGCTRVASFDYQNVEKDGMDETQAENLLMASGNFFGTETGGEVVFVAPQVPAFKVLLKSLKGVAHFRRIFSEGELGGRLYGLCGLFFLGQSEFAVNLQQTWTLDGQRGVSLGGGGCEDNPTSTVVRILDGPHPGANGEFCEALRASVQ